MGWRCAAAVLIFLLSIGLPGCASQGGGISQKTVAEALSQSHAVFIDQTSASSSNTSSLKCDQLTDPSDKQWVACSTSALEYANSHCEAAAASLKKQESVFQEYSFATIAFASVFTGLGASTLASAKAFGVLGGTTGIGAFSSATNSASASDNSAVSSISSLLTTLQKYPSDSSNPSPMKIYQFAVGTAAQCGSVATTAGNTSNPAPTSGSK